MALTCSTKSLDSSDWPWVKVKVGSRSVSSEWPWPKVKLGSRSFRYILICLCYNVRPVAILFLLTSLKLTWIRKTKQFILVESHETLCTAVLPCDGYRALTSVVNGCLVLASGFFPLSFRPLADSQMCFFT